MSFQQPPLIRYNLKERGRKYNGIKRSFDIANIVKNINSPETQEKVRTRAMMGYHGHWPRIMFGLEPSEGGMKGGKPVSIEPAFVTTHLKAYDNGDIEHQVEILETEPGLIVRRMYSNRVGGFSSAINMDTNQFYGFDYVNDPNYSTNRGYELALDSASDGGMGIIGMVMAEQEERMQSMQMLLDQYESGLTMALDSATQLERDNNELLDLLASNKADRDAAIAAKGGIALDGIVATKGHSAAAKLEREGAMFKSAKLPSIESPESEKQDKPDPSYTGLVSRIFNR